MRTTLLVGLVTLSAQLARADYEGSSFGDSGVVVPSGAITFDYTSTNIAGISGSVTTLTLAPRLMVFVSQNLAIGGEVSLTMVKVEDVDAATAGGIGARIGYNVPLGGSVSWFPNAGLGFVGGGGIKRLPLDIEAPFLIHFGNFFIGIGPALVVDIWGKLSVDAGPYGEDDNGYRQLTFRITTSLGGWIPTGDGDWDDVMPPPAEEPPHEAAPPPPSPSPTPAPVEPAPAGGDEEDEWT